jgi:hypothetical protein
VHHSFAGWHFRRLQWRVIFMDTMSPSTNNKETQRVNANCKSHLARSFIALFQRKWSSSLLSLALAIVAAIVLLVLVHGVFPKWLICNLLGCYIVLASGAQQDPLVPISTAITIAGQDTVSVVLGGSDKIRTQLVPCFNIVRHFRRSNRIQRWVKPGDGALSESINGWR